MRPGRDLEISGGKPLQTGRRACRNVTKLSREATAIPCPSTCQGGRGQRSPAWLSNPLVSRKERLVMSDFIGSFWFFVIGGVILVGLVILLLVMRNRREED